MGPCHGKGKLIAGADRIDARQVCGERLCVQHLDLPFIHEALVHATDLRAGVARAGLDQGLELFLCTVEDLAPGADAGLVGWDLCPRKVFAVCVFEEIVAGVCGRVSREARYEGLLVEQSGRAFLRISLPTGTMHEIQVGKAVKLKNAYKLDDPVKGGRMNRDLDTVDIPTARPVVIRMDRSGMTPPPVSERRSGDPRSSPGRRS